MAIYNNISYDTNWFIEKSTTIHSNKFDYSLVEYKNHKSPVIIICKIHGEFLQQPRAHLAGNGCISCSKKKKKSTEEFIEDAIKVHGDVYDYSNVVYIGAKTPVIITCKSHGDFNQSPTNHLSGRGCKLCSSNVSKLSNKWLNSLNINSLIYEYRIPENRNMPVDAYDPITNTVYQFHGSYWHGDPRVFHPNNKNSTNNILYGDLYKMTLKRDNYIKSLGYNLIIMWEYDFCYSS